MEYGNDIESDTNSVILSKTFIPTSWTPQGTSKIKEWIYEARLLGDSHNDSAIYFNTLNKSFTVANIIFAALSASSSFFSVGTNSTADKNNKDVISTSITTFFSVSTVITSGIVSVFNWNIRHEFHKIMANEYLNISKKLEGQLCIPIDKRDDILLLFTEITSKFEELNMRAPLLPKWIVSKVKLRLAYKKFN